MPEAPLDASFGRQADVALAGECAAATSLSLPDGSRPAPSAERLGRTWPPQIESSSNLGPGRRPWCRTGALRRVPCNRAREAQKAPWWRGMNSCASPSSLRVRMNRSSTAMLPCRPTAPNRARTSWSSHHSRYSSPNSLPWSLTVYLGVRPARLAASSSTMQIFPAVGRLLKDARPRERRDRCSMTTATHQQNGQDCSREKGNQLVQKGVEHLADC